MFVPRGPNHLRCQACAVKHSRQQNAAYQHAFRQRHPTNAKPRTVPDAVRYQFEMLHAEGLTANAIAQKLGHSHHTVLKHLARPEARLRVDILRRLDMPELPH
jgi:DNA invertase Pin-like site-specific DNA recombinase